MKYLPILLLLFLSACSPKDWIARIYIVRAEGEVDRASELKSKKIPFEKRTEFYSRACGFFMKAYLKDPGIFTLTRIETAADSCWKAGKIQEEEVFKLFAEDYIQKHPQEYEYGDSGAAMMEMG